MQFTTILTLIAGASAAALKARQTSVEVDIFNNSKCAGDAVNHVTLTEVGQCVSFEQGYGAASIAPQADGTPYLLAVFHTKDCTTEKGAPDVVGLGCAVNHSEDAVWSVGLIENPAVRQ
ncbi:hypothetical protein F5Y17DRAFT_78703 [Xylariaceae sp. FL0594]|nr:hypothetical protein F5Y17DRAFT_78703 [Xylariaceae sp. FL0594]